MSGELAAVYATVDKNKNKSSQQLHQEPVRDVYAVVDKTKKIRNKDKSSQQLHQEPVRDVYAVVDKTKKIRNKDKSSQQLHQEQVTDVYAVVDKTKKIGNKDKSSPSQDLSHAHAVLENIKQINSERNGKGDCDVGPAGEMFTTDNAIQYDFTSVPVYEEVERIQESSAKRLRKCNNKSNREIQKTGCKYPVIIASCLTVLITAVVVVAVAVVIALALIAGLHSELNSVMKNEESNFKQKLDQLQHDFHFFSSNTSDLLVGISHNTSESVSNLRQYANFSLELMLTLIEATRLLGIKVNVLNNTFNEEISSMKNKTYLLIQNLKKEISESITDSNGKFQISINTLKNGLARGIQTLHIFSSCEAVFNFSIRLPSGTYMIRSGNTAIDMYCSTTIAVFCNGIPGWWRRIAYLNNNENPVSCPDGFEVRSDTSSPPLCRRMNTSAGCSSVVYPSNGMSYSQVCGTVRVHPAGTPDGFDTFDTKSEEDYVDGVSIAYGDSSNRNHIWTYTAAVTVRDSTKGCDQCTYMKPSNIPGTNFTCNTAHCSDGDNCFSNTLWGNEAQQCFGNETFYRQLSESTTDNIEMRVCRDQGRIDEDILISFVELLVL